MNQPQNMLTVDAVRWALENDPTGLPSKEIAEIINRDRRYVLKILKDLHTNREVVIRRWIRPGKARSGPIVPAYDLRRKPNDRDAAKPRPYTNSEAQRRYRDRHAGRLKAREALRKGISYNPFGQLAGFTAKPKVWVHEVKADVLRLHNAGMSIQGIADELLCSRSTVTRALVELGLHAVKPRMKMEHFEPTIIRLLAEGRSTRQIAKEAGCSRSLVYKVKAKLREQP